MTMRSLTRTTASRTTVRDSGIGLSSGYNDGHAAGVGGLPMNMAKDYSRSSHTSPHRFSAASVARAPGINALGSSGRTSTPTASSSSRGMADHASLSRASRYNHGGGMGASATSVGSSLLHGRYGGAHAGSRDSLQPPRDDDSKRFSYGDYSAPAQRSSSRAAAAARKFTLSDSDSDTEPASASAHTQSASRYFDDRQSSHTGGRRLVDGGLREDAGREKEKEAHKLQSRRSPSVFEDDDKENGTFSAASTRSGERTSSHRLRRRGGGAACLWERWEVSPVEGAEAANLKALGTPQSSRPRALVGLTNLGNTCFMNSCLQCLNHTAPLSSYFISDNWKEEINPSSKSAQLAKDYAALCGDMWKSGKGSINPTSLKLQISKWARQFSGYNQHDSQELLRFLIDGMQEGLLRPKKEPPWPYDDDHFDEREVAEQSRRMWDNYLARNDSLVTRIFCGQLRSRVICGVCNKESNCYDPFMDLSLPIPKGKGRHMGPASQCTLHECLREFAAEERLEGNDTYYCSKCKTHQCATKSMRVFRLPSVLVLHLKRFSKGSYSRGKLNTVVDFPISTLDLSEYLAPESPDAEACKFHLYGLTNHSGSTEGGHYIAHCKNYDDGSWYCFNDQRVTKVDTPPIDGTAYLLFYARL